MANSVTADVLDRFCQVAYSFGVNQSENNNLHKGRDANTSESVSPTPLKCPCCGGNIKPHDEKCLYCGTSLVWDTTEKDTQHKDYSSYPIFPPPITLAQ